jgi:ribosomal protein S18 acetylase RimI-like enzyme
MSSPNAFPANQPKGDGLTAGLSTFGLSEAGTYAQQLQLKLRPVVDSDLPFLFQIFATSRPDILTLPWPDEQKVQFLLQQLGAQRADYERRFPGAANSIVERQSDEGTEPLGRIWVANTGTELRLLDILLAPQHTGQGFGTALLRDLIELAQTLKLPLRHAVDPQNGGARRLYERLGFVVTEDVQSHLFMTYQPEATDL